MTCLTETTVVQFFAGDLAGDAAERLDQHVDSCPPCRALLSAAARSSQGARSASVSPPAAAGVTFAVGAVVAGRYQILRFLGRGGMGEVYEAEDRHLGERIALKTVASTIADDPRMAARLKREVQLARKVTHPNVCRIFDLGGDGELALLTMELVPGETLWRRLTRGGRMSAVEAAPLVRQMAAALSAAHQAGVVHRDFKSDNVMLTPSVSQEGGLRAVVTDFGLARLDAGGTDEDPLAAAASSVAVGSIGYVSPEQLEGRPATAAADLYALGVVMYEMVTGVWPFLGSSPAATARMRLLRPPRPARELVPDLDPSWDRIILRCLERDPTARPASAEEILAALAPTPAPPVRRRGRGRWLALPLVAALLAGSALARRCFDGEPRRCEGCHARRG